MGRYSLRPAGAFIALILLTLLIPASGRAKVPGEKTRLSRFSLIDHPAHRNFPPFLIGLGVAPYPEGPAGRLKVDEKAIPTTVVVDFDRRLVIVEKKWKGIALTYPWVGDFGDYESALFNHARADRVKALFGGGGIRAPGSIAGGAFNIDLPVRFPKTLSRIIGQGANIQVSGSESITFSGETRYNLKERANEAGGQRIFPELDMRQQLQVNLTGTIGEKVKVEMQHNSESQVPLENRIKLRYEGDEDEVIQRIEVGNTNLSLPGNQFVSLSAQQQGLFGIKVVGKAGKVDFTSVLSQQQGQTDRETFSGRSRRDSIVIDDLNYVKGRYFVVNDYDSIVDFRVFMDDNSATNNDGSQMPGRAFLYDRSTGAFDSTASEQGEFDELQQGLDYIILKEVGLLQMQRSLRDSEILAIWFTRSVGQGANARLDTVGFIPDPVPAVFGAGDSLAIKVIRPRAEDYRPPPIDDTQTLSRFADTWYYQLRNVYDLRGRNIQPDGFEISIYRKEPGATERFDRNDDGVPFTQIMGLDLIGDNPQQPPDFLVDDYYYACEDPRFSSSATNRLNVSYQSPVAPDTLGLPGGNLPYWPERLVYFDDGLLWFPDPRPFDPQYNHQKCENGVLTLADGDRNRTLYDVYDPKATDSRYAIEVKYSTAQSSFSLGRSNILEGSEVVKLNGRTLSRGSDYRIIYEIGQIEFLTDEALEDDADISIDFEYAPFLAQAQKSLIGTALSYNLAEHTKLSGIFLFKGKRTPFRRPRLGQEPSRIFVTGLSVSSRHSPDFLTRWTDAIPGVRARTESRLDVSFETAATFPNPNTKNAIYVDDMEGTEEVSSFGLTRRQWHYMSIPQLSTLQDEIAPEDRYQDVDWYNPRNSTERRYLNPDLTKDEGNKTIPVLEIALEDGTIASDGLSGENGWGGIMRLVSKTGLNMKDRKFFEVWVNDFELGRGKMHIDMGLLGEDAMWSKDPPNNSLDTEDRNLDGVLDDSGGNDPGFDEDTGLDGLFNPSEPDGADNDDWAYDENDKKNYSQINGTEGNGYLDTEDLNGNGGNPDREKSFFRFTFDFETEENMVASVRTMAEEGAPLNWRLFRIPLARAGETSIESEPTFDQGIKYVRIWFEDVDSTNARFQIASMEVTGNRWLEAGIQDSNGAIIPEAEADPEEILAAGVINNKDGEDYDPPPVEIQVENGTPEKEQSLLIQYEKLNPGHTGTVFRALFEDEDYTRYRELEYWVQLADPNRLDETDIFEDPFPVFFFRFGGDSLNFYEVIDTLDSKGWRKVSIDLAEMTRVKLIEEPTFDSLYGRQVEVRQVQVGSRILRAVGQPSMTKVRRLTFGASNPSRDKALHGIIWVDDLRLLNVKGDGGYAARLGVDLGLSDFISFNGDLRLMGKEFRKLTGGGGSGGGEDNPRNGSDNREISLRGGVNLSKFLETPGINLPLDWGWSSSLKEPELKTGSDIVLDDPSMEKTENRSRSISTSLNRTRKSPNPFLYYTVDNMNLKLSASESRALAPTRADSSQSNAVDWRYNYSPRFNTELQIFRDWKINPLPQSAGISANRKRSESRYFDIRSGDRRKSNSRSSVSSYNFAMTPLSSRSVTTRFNFSANRDHMYGRPLPMISSLNRGLETKRSHDANVSYSPGFEKYLSWLNPRFSYDTRFTDDQPPTRTVTEFDSTGAIASERRIHDVVNQNTSRMDFNIGVGKLMDLLPGGGSGKSGKGASPVAKPEEGDSADGSGGGRGPDPMALFRGIRSVGSRIGDISGSVALVRNSTFNNLVGRPGAKYQFGLTSEVDESIQYNQGVQQRRADKSRDLQTRASSSIRLPKTMNLRLSYNRSVSKNDQSRNITERESTTWPDVNYSWDGIQNIGKLKEYFKNASLNMGFSRKTDRSGKSLEDPDTEHQSSNWSPLAQIDTEFKNGMQTKLGVDQAEDRTLNFRGGGSETIRRSRDVTASVSYRTSSRKKINIPILGKGRKGGTYTATTTFRLSVRYSKQKEEEPRRDLINSHRRTFDIAPSVSWTWLQNLSGSLELRFGENRDLKNENKSTRTIGASVSALFKF